MAATGQEPTDNTRDRILEVTTVLYRQRGWNGTGTAAVAKELHITGPALYYHFSSKQEILFAAVRHSIGRLVEATHAAVGDDGSPAERLRRFTAAHVGYQLGQLQGVGRAPYGVEQLMDHLSEEQQKELRTLQRAQVDLLRGIIENGIADGVFFPVDATATAFAILGMCEHVMYWFHAGGRRTRQEIEDLYGNLAVRMVERPVMNTGGD